jgi:hypothetical protein
MKSSVFAVLEVELSLEGQSTVIYVAFDWSSIYYLGV